MPKTKITFFDKKVYKGISYNKESILDVQTHHYQPTETFGTRTSIRVAHQAWRKAFKREKRSGF